LKPCSARLAISHDAEDHYLFLKTLQDMVARDRWLCRVYALIDTHDHLLIEPPRAICLMACGT
jgi:hypothetical protein